jgi:hypothetical protein
MNPYTLTAQVQAYLPQIVGAAGIPVIQQAVEFLKVQFKMPTYLAPIAAVIIGAAINTAASYFTGIPTIDGFVIGLGAGALACGYHELTKPTA